MSSYTLFILSSHINPLLSAFLFLSPPPPLSLSISHTHTNQPNFTKALSLKTIVEDEIAHK